MISPSILSKSRPAKDASVTATAVIGAFPIAAPNVALFPSNTWGIIRCAWFA